MALLFIFTGKGDNNTTSITYYDYIEEPKPSVRYNTSTERLVINENLGDGGRYHKAVLYHSAGPNTSSSMKKAATDEHIYNSPEGEVPVYEDPSLSQVRTLAKRES